MTRSRAQAIHDKVNSLLTLHTFDVAVNGVLPHGTTLCVLRYEPPKERQDDAGSDQEKGHDAVKKDREDGQEDASKKVKKKAKEESCQEGRPPAQGRPALPYPRPWPGLAQGRPPCTRPAGSATPPALSPALHKAGLPAQGRTVLPPPQPRAGLAPALPKAGLPAWNFGVFDPCTPHLPP